MCAQPHADYRLPPEVSALMLDLAKPSSRPLPLGVDPDSGLFLPVEGGFQYIVANPAFGEAESALTQALDCLAPGGTCTCIVPNGFLSRSADESLRKTLVEDHWLSRIILLPLHVFHPVASVRAAILAVTKAPAPPGAAIELTDLRSALPGQGLDELLRTGCVPRQLLDTARVREKHYVLIPEEYGALPPPPGEEELEELDRELEDLRRRRRGEGDQLSLFPAQPLPLGEDRLWDPQLLSQGRRCLDARFLRWLHQTPALYRPGRVLFQLRVGEKEGGESRGFGVPRYTAAGRSGFAGRPTEGVPVPALIISRVGNYCGAVYRCETPCFVSANAWYLTDTSDLVRPDILWLLLRCAGLNRCKRGSGQPYLAREQLLDRLFPVPAPEEQDRFLRQEEALLSEVRTLEAVLG